MTTARGEGKLEGYEEGRAKGMAEGRAEGAHKKALEIAIKMKEQGLSKEDIINITGLTAEELF